jgi:hypothetical protein
MAIYQGHLQGTADMPRMLFRSRHIYILLASLLNLCLDTYLTRQPGGWRRTLQLLGPSSSLLRLVCSWPPSYTNRAAKTYSTHLIVSRELS